MTRQDIIGTTLTIVLVCFLGSMGALAYYAGRGKPYDPETLCPTNRAVPHTAIIVDRTDPFTDQQTNLLISVLTRTTEALGEDDRLSLFVISGTTDTPPTPILSVCKPTDGANANWLYENRKLLRAHYDKQFDRPIRTLIDELAEPASASHSPIMEMIYGVALLPTFGDGSAQRTLIVISDLLQNTPSYSHYRNAPDYEAFRQTPYGISVSALLQSVYVELVYLPNKQAIHHQGGKHLSFWRAYFTKAGARSITVTPPQSVSAYAANNRQP